MSEPRDTFTNTAPEVPMLRKPNSAEASQFTAVRDNAVEYKGTDGDVEFVYSTARAAYAAQPKGSYLAFDGMSDRIVLEKQFNLPPQLSAVTQAPAADTFTTAALLANLAADHDFEVLGTNAVSADVTLATTGGITVATHGGATDSTIILPHLTTGQSPWTKNVWATSKSVRWECDLVTTAGIADTTIWAGLKTTNTPVTVTDNEQCFFRFHEDASGGSWEAIASVAGTDSVTDTGVDVAASTRYHLVIDIDSSRIARMYINGALVKTTAALASGNLIPYVGVLSDTTGTAKSIRLIRERISKLAA